MNAFVACCAEVNRPGTGPLMSDALAIVIVELVMPGPFLKPAQLAAAGPPGRPPPPPPPPPVLGVLPPPPPPPVPFFFVLVADPLGITTMPPGPTVGSPLWDALGCA